MYGFLVDACAHVLRKLGIPNVFTFKRNVLFGLIYSTSQVLSWFSHTSKKSDVLSYFLSSSILFFVVYLYILIESTRCFYFVYSSKSLWNKMPIASLQFCLLALIGILVSAFTIVLFYAVFAASTRYLFFVYCTLQLVSLCLFTIFIYSYNKVRN